MRWWCLAVVLVSACSTYSVRRAALVPHLAPTARNGQPLAGGGEVAAGTSSLLRAGAPREGDANAGVEIPRVDVNGALRLRLGRDFDLGFVWDHGLASGATPIAEDQPRPGNGNVYGGGLSAQWAAPLGADPSARIGLTADVLVYSVPYVEYRTCVDCSTPMTTIERGRGTIGVFALGVIPSYRIGRATIYGGMTMRNHPMAVRGEVDENELFDSDRPVETGPINFIASAGTDVDLGYGVRVWLQAYLPLTQAPVAYSPTLAAGLTIPLAAPRAQRMHPVGN